MNTQCNGNQPTKSSHTNIAREDKFESLDNYEHINSLNRCPKNYVSPKILVKLESKDIGHSLYSNSYFTRNDTLYERPILFSELRKSPDMHTIQVAKTWHWCTKKHPIQYTQHSCFKINCKFVLEDVTDPSSTTNVNETINQDYAFATFKLVALQNIDPGTVLTVNYNSFEWEMSCGFLDADAGREVRGFGYALPDEKKFLKDRELLFPHIEEIINSN